jgi:hypothetical protein
MRDYEGPWISLTLIRATAAIAHRQFPTAAKYD